MPDEHISSTVCQVSPVSQAAQDEDIDIELLGKLTTADRQAIRDHARAAADAMAGAAGEIMERWAKPSGVDEVALHRAVKSAWRIRFMADALEELEKKGG